MKRTKLSKILVFILAIAFILPLIPGFSIIADANSNVEFTVDINKTGAPVKDVFSMFNQWDYGWYWSHFADDQPASYFNEHYSFAKTVQIMTATGGSAERDLFIDPFDRTVTDDYKFDSLIQACRNIVNQGLTPYIKTGNVPLKLSANPHISDSYGVNVRPPYDYELYYDYIKAIADALIAEFGLDEVKTWYWCLFTEFENRNWFHVEGDRTGELTKQAFFKVYDYTVAALQKAIGAENLIVGAHAMVWEPLQAWDPRDLLTHCANGTNSVTGNKGSQIDFITYSIYDQTVGNLGQNREFALTNSLNFLRDRAISVGLTDLMYGIDEGYILNGSDNRTFQLSHMTAATYQGAYMARHFKQALDTGLDWYSLWLYNTDAIWGSGDVAAEAVSTHIARLGSRMAGDRRAEVVRSGAAAVAANQVDAVASFDSNANTARVMAYNFNESRTAASSETIGITLNNIAANIGDTVNVRKWYVDDDSNWFRSWTADSSSLGANDYVFSRDNIQQPISISSDRGKDLWYANVDRYIEMSRLKFTDTVETIENNSLTLDATIKNHGVVFFEITNIKQSGADSTEPVAFTPANPANNSTVLSVKPEFRWNAGAASSYSLVVSKNADLSSPIINVSNILGTSYIPETPLERNTTYYWRVTAVQSNSNIEAPVQSFVTRGNVPGYFALTSPGWGSVVPVTPTLTWAASPGATSYTLILSPHDNLNDPLIIVKGLTSTTYTVTSPLEGGREYYWTVIAVNNSGVTTTLSWKRPFNTASTESTMIDNFDGGLNKTYERLNSGPIGPGGFWYDDTANQALWGSAYNLFREADRDAHIVYKFENARSLRAVGLFASDEGRGVSDFTFHTSPDGENWTPVHMTTANFADDDSLRGGLWTRRTYTFNDALPAGTNYVKVEFGRGPEWVNRLNQVILSRLAIAEEPRPVQTEIIDELDDWSKVFSRTGALSFIDNVPDAWQDNSRVFWWEGHPDQSEQNLVYLLEGVKTINATGLFGTNIASDIKDFEFFTSPNNSKWTKLELTENNFTDDSINGGDWIRRNYTFTELPQGANFVKVQFGGNTWAIQLGRVELSKIVSVERDEIEDHLDNWSLVYSRTAGLAFITDVPDLWQDNCRVFWWEQSDQTPGQNVTYNLPGAKSVEATGLFSTNNLANIRNFNFYASPDNSTWAQLTLADDNYKDDPLHSGNWTRRNYSFNLPDGTNFVKIEWTANTWQRQLGWVRITKNALPTIPGQDVTEIIDNFDEGMSKIYSSSSDVGTGFWIVNDAPHLWGINSLFRANDTPEHIVYSLNSVKSIRATGNFASDGGRGVSDFVFSISPNGTTWTPLMMTNANYRDEMVLNNGLWTTRYYYFDDLPEGTNFVRIEFGRMVSWANRLDFVHLSAINLGNPPPPPPIIIDDPLNNWNFVYFRTPGLSIQTGNEHLWEDNSRVFWWENPSNDQTPGQHFIYKIEGVQTIEVKGLFAHVNRPIANFLFYVSADNSTWTQLEITADDYTDDPLNNGSWTRRNYSFTNLPDGMNYVKIEFPGNSWVIQVGAVRLTNIKATVLDPCEEFGHELGPAATCTEDQICIREGCGVILAVKIYHIPGDKSYTRVAACGVTAIWIIECVLCEAILETGIEDALECIGGEMITTPATCTENGFWETRCTLCNDVLENGIINAFGHNHIIQVASIRTSSTNLQNNTTVTLTFTVKCQCGDERDLSGSVKLRQSGTQLVAIQGYEITVIVNSNNMIINIPQAPKAAPPPNQGGNSQR